MFGYFISRMGTFFNKFFQPWMSQITQSGRVGLAPPLLYDWYKCAHKKGRAHRLGLKEKFVPFCCYIGL